jgi:hypothetical protein
MLYEEIGKVDIYNLGLKWAQSRHFKGNPAVGVIKGDSTKSVLIDIHLWIELFLVGIGSGIERRTLEFLEIRSGYVERDNGAGQPSFHQKGDG